jgi:hypothetical protein
MKYISDNAQINNGTTGISYCRFVSNPCLYTIRHLDIPMALYEHIATILGEADHSPPSSAEVKNAWSYTSTPPVRLHGVVLLN